MLEIGVSAGAVEPPPALHFSLPTSASTLSKQCIIATHPTCLRNTTHCFLVPPRLVSMLIRTLSITAHHVAR
jgi:hypothetical protein